MTNGKNGDRQREGMMERRMREREWSMEGSIEDELMIQWHTGERLHAKFQHILLLLVTVWKVTGDKLLQSAGCLSLFEFIFKSEPVGAVVYLFHCNISTTNANFHMDTTKLYAGTQNSICGSSVFRVKRFKEGQSGCMNIAAVGGWVGGRLKRCRTLDPLSSGFYLAHPPSFHFSISLSISVHQTHHLPTSNRP